MRVIQVGIGGFGRSWTGVVRATPGFELVGVVDPSHAARQWACDDLQMPPERCYATLDEALASAECDAVLVVSPEHTHYAVAKQALEASKHVLVEKPLTATLEEGQALVGIAARTGQILMVSQQYRYRPPARTVQRLVADSAVGRVLSVKVVCRRDTRAMWPDNRYRLEVRHPYLLGMAIHHVDLLRALTGHDVAQVYCRSWRVPDSPYHHDPAVAALMELEGGATVIYEGDWATHGMETSWDGEWEIVGEAGRIRWTASEATPGGQEVMLQRWGQPAQTVEQVQLPVVDRAAILQSLHDAVESGRLPETHGADNLKSLAVVFACMRSADTGELVRLGDLLDAGSALASM